MRELYIGVMSGTSMDGVDTALVEIDDDHIELVAHHDTPMPKALKQRLLQVCMGQPTHLIEIGELDHQLGHLFADAVNQLLLKTATNPSEVRAIGNHGQTVFHQPTGAAPFTIQLGDANIIAAKTGIDTIADFRRKDMALGGQGAPLVPAFHQQIFASQDSSVVVLNIGGIANISVLPVNGPVVGYDTGPGNMLMDAWCQLHTGKPFDQDAYFALQGQVNHALLVRLLQEPYFSLPAPKSTGRELFNLDWLKQHLTTDDLFAHDVQNTLCEFSAQSIANEVRRHQQGPKPELLVCGGGARNPLLMGRLTVLLDDWLVMPTTDKGINGDYMEAMAFAWLAQRRVHGLPSNLPDVTGASKLASLGVVYFAD